MLMEPVPCSKMKCKHYRGVKQPDGTEESERDVCTAFPNGIPYEITSGKNMHKEPYPGDHGIQYERDEPKDDVNNERLTLPMAINLADAVLNVMKPSTKLKKDGMSPEKACKILEDGEANGHPLTKKQRGMFGVLCGQRKEPTKNTGDLHPQTVRETLGEAILNAFCPTGKGGGVKTDCSPKGAGGGKSGGGKRPIVGKAFGAPAKKPTVGKAFTEKSSPAKSSSGAKTAAKAPAKPSAPAVKPKTVVKVSAATMKAAKKLVQARDAATKSGDKDKAKKANEKLKQLVVKAKSREGSVGKKKAAPEAKKAETKPQAKQEAPKTEAKSSGGRERSAGKVTAAKKKATARIAEIAAKAAKSGDIGKLQKAKAKLAKIVEKAGRGEKTEAKSSGGRERSKGKRTAAKAKAAGKLAKAAESAAKSGDMAKLKKIKKKLEKIVSRATPTRNHRLVGQQFELTTNEGVETLETAYHLPLAARAYRLALFVTNYHEAEHELLQQTATQNVACSCMPNYTTTRTVNKDGGFTVTVNCEGKKKCGACAAKDAAKAKLSEIEVENAMKSWPGSKASDGDMAEWMQKSKIQCKRDADGNWICPMMKGNPAEPHRVMDKTVIVPMEGKSMMTNATISTSELIEVGEWLEDNGLMPGYGQVYLNESEGHVWYVGGDGDEWAEKNLPVKKFKAVPGVQEVTYEAESFPPEDAGFVRVYPALTENDDCMDRCRAICTKEKEKAGRETGKEVGKVSGKVAAKESYFENCPRDKEGQCKKGGTAGTGVKLPAEESGAAGGS